jgi:putative membrane protein
MAIFMRLAFRLVLLAIIFAIVAWIVPGIDIHGGFGSLLWIAFLFSLVNLILGPLFHFFGFPLVVLTLGLFLLVINAGLLAITAGLTKDLDVDTFWDALLGGFLIALFSWGVELFMPLRPNRG